MPPSSEIDGQVALSGISEKETMHYFSESLKQAASIARQLAERQQNPIWADIAKLLNEMRKNGEILANSKSMSRINVLKDLAAREQKLGIVTEETAGKGKLII